MTAPHFGNPRIDAPLARYAASSDPDALDETIAELRTALADAITYERTVIYTLGLATMLIVRGQSMLGKDADIAEAGHRIDVVRRTGRLDPVADAGARVLLCTAKLSMPRGADRLDVVEEVLNLTGRPPTGMPAEGIAGLANLRAAALVERYTSLRDPVDLDRSIRLLRKNLHRATQRPLRAALANTLGTALIMEYARTADESLMREALEVTAEGAAIQREAAESGRVSALEPQVVRALCTRAHVLAMRWRTHRLAADIDEALDTINDIMNTIEKSHPSYGETMLLAAGVLDDLGTGDRDVEVLDQALEFYDEALEALRPGTMYYRAAATAAAATLGTRFELTGESYDLDLALALNDIAREGIDAPENLAVLDNNRAILLYDRFVAHRRPGDLDEAIVLHERSLRIGAGLDQDTQLIRAAMTYFARYVELASPEDLARSRRLLTEVSASPRTPVGHFQAATTFANIAAEVEDWATCADAAQSALDAVETVLGALEIGRWEDWLSQAQGVAAVGAVAAVRSGDPARALTLAERGCGVIAAARISQQRTSLTQARADGHGSLVDEFERATELVRLALARDGRQAAVSPPTGGGLLQAELHVDRADIPAAVLALGTARRNLITVAPNLRPGADLPDLIALVAETGEQLVYLIASTVGGVSVHVCPAADGRSTPVIEVHELPDLTEDAIDLLAARIHLPDQLDGDRPLHPVRAATRGPRPDEVNAVVSELGTLLAGAAPALAAGGRIVTVGLLGLLPVTAALSRHGLTIHAGMAGSGLLHVAALLNGRRTAATVGIVAVTNPQPCHWHGEELAFLGSADDEAEFLSERFGARVRRGERATADSVRALLWDSPLAVLHISAHGRTSEHDPDQVQLLFADGADGSATTVGIDDLPADMHCAAVFLACCWLARTSGRMPAEAIGFPTTLIQAGVARVVAPLWPVDDYATYCFVVAYYEKLLGPDGDARRALAHARDGVRRQAATDPNLYPDERARMLSTADAFVLIGA